MVTKLEKGNVGPKFEVCYVQRGQEKNSDD